MPISVARAVSVGEFAVSGRSPGLETRRSQRFGQAEVEDFYRAVGANFHIRGLQVAMNDALLVRRLERFRDLAGDGEGVGERDSLRMERRVFRPGGRSPGLKPRGSI